MASQVQAGSAPIAILAGNGRLPLEIAEGLIARGESVYIIGVGGEADPEITRFDHDLLDWGQVGHLLQAFRERGVRRVMLAGGISRRPELNLKRMDWATIRTLPDILGALLGGDNTVLTSVITLLERRGFTVPSVPDLLPELLAKAGSNTSRRVTGADRDRLALGADVVRTLGRFDVGQGVVVVGRRPVAIEGVEGTDAMLARVAELRESGRLSRKHTGVLVKWCKPGQDLRADLPTIGPQTVTNVHAAGLAGIGVEADRTIVLDRQKTLDLAKKLDVFIMGMRGPTNGQPV